MGGKKTAGGILVLAGLAGAPASLAQSNYLELGAGYSNRDSYHFGQYSGITSQGGYTSGGFSLQQPVDATRSRYWFLNGSGLGQETGRFDAGWGTWGGLQVRLSFDQLPRYRYNDGSTPFLGSGTTRQVLPAGWVGATSTRELGALSASLKEVNLDTRRQRFGGAFTWELSSSWELMGEFRHELKEGSETLGAIFGSSGGNPRGSLLARPVDYQTDEATLGVSFADAVSQYNFSYQAMRFGNHADTLRFDNPFNNPAWAAGANFSDGAVGSMALEPDNRSSRFAFSGTRAFGAGTRVSASVASTRLVQDTRFLGYSSVIHAPAALPRPSLDGRVDSLVANLNLSARPTPATSLRLHYRYRDRDNRTPRDNYRRVAGDAALQEALVSEGTRVNRVYDLRRVTLGGDLVYRLGKSTRLSGGYQHETTDRSMMDVATTREEALFIKLDSRPSEFASAWLKLQRSERDASTYDSTVPFRSGHNPDYVATLVGEELFDNDPFLRRYHLTDRQRDELSAGISWYPSTVIGISLLAKASDDDFPGALVGVQGSENRNLGADLSWTPETNWSASVYYNQDRYENLTRGYTRLGASPETPFFPESARLGGLYWTVGTTDRVHTWGSSLDWDLLGGRLDLGLDLSYSTATTDTVPFSAGELTLPIGGVTTDLPYPDVETDIRNLSLKATYILRPGREVRLRWFYQDYAAVDWALDAVQVDSASNVLLLGQQGHDYGGHLVELSLVFRFGG